MTITSHLSPRVTCLYDLRLIASAMSISKGLVRIGEGFRSRAVLIVVDAKSTFPPGSQMVITRLIYALSRLGTWFSDLVRRNRGGLRQSSSDRERSAIAGAAH